MWGMSHGLQHNTTQHNVHKIQAWSPLIKINEGVRINNTKSDTGYPMNSKSEFQQGEVPRVANMW